MSGPSEDETVLLANFIELTGLDINTASHYMQAANYDISLAFSLLPESSSSASTPSSDINPNYELQADVNIRAADPARQEQLLGRGSVMNHEREMAFARAEDPNVNWMFPPPNHISFPGSIQEARFQAKNDSKWLLFNIQNHNEFSSHMLNRDVWTNDTLISLIRRNFLFWQRGTTSVDGKNFLSMYQISEFGDDLPLVGIIDPRTGGIIFTMKGSYDATELTLRIIEFLDENSMSSSRAPVTRNLHVKPPGSAEAASHDDDEEYVYDKDSGDEVDRSRGGGSDDDEEDVAAAIAMSLQQENKASGWTLDPEPAEGSEGVSKISFRLLFSATDPSSGKVSTSIVRRFNGNVYVSQLFAFVSSLLPPEYASKRFDLLTGYPRASLKTSITQTLDESRLAGSQIMMKWE